MSFGPFAVRGVWRGDDSVILYLLSFGVNTILGDTVTGDKWREINEEFPNAGIV
ncbi:MAG: hypothetical protein IPP63_07280 [Chloracidobacterium sp.]|nr:hypothetical protein [Chloracidobacterium sp.]